MPAIPDHRRLVEIAGTESGLNVVHKFGSATVGTSFTPVTYAQVYQTPTAATALEFVGGVADTAAGAGAAEITVQGLDGNWEEDTRTFDTNGSTPVALPTDLTRLYRWFVSASGSYATATSGSHSTTLTIRVAGAGATWAQLDATDIAKGQSEIACYTVPLGKHAYVLSQHVQVDSTKSADVLFLQRPNANDVTAPYSGTLRLINQFFGVADEAHSRPDTPVGGPFVGPCDLIHLGRVGTGTGSIAIDFEILTFDS